MDFDGLLADQQAREAAGRVSQQQHAARAAQELRLVTDAAASCRHVCAQVAARVRALNRPTVKVFYPQPEPELPYVWAYGWPVAWRVLLEDGRLTMGAHENEAPPLGNVDVTVERGQYYRLTRAGHLRPGERFSVIDNQDPLTVVTDRYGWPKFLDEDLELKLAPSGLQHHDTTDGRVVMWRDRRDCWDARWYPLGPDLVDLLRTR